MENERVFKVWGYPAKSISDWNLKGVFIGSTETLEEAHKLQGSAKSSGWESAIILDGDLAVE
jgi:hypothetical protein